MQQPVNSGFFYELLMRFPKNITVYGDKTYRGECPVEDVEHIDFFSRLSIDWPQYHAIAIHPKNEGKRTWGQINKEKKMGLNKGASDIIIPASPPLVIEMKRLDHTKSKMEKEQAEYLISAQDLGATVCIALGCNAALLAVEEWHKKRT